MGSSNKDLALTICDFGALLTRLGSFKIRAPGPDFISAIIAAGVVDFPVK
jgi:hypothetical protein